MFFKDDVLQMTCKDFEGEFLQWVLLESMKHQILDPVHNYSGHHGIDKTSAVIKRCFGQKCCPDI